MRDATIEEKTSVEKGECPFCGHEGFYAGPEGGLCINVMCANDNCCARFNLGPGLVQVIRDPISNSGGFNERCSIKQIA